MKQKNIYNNENPLFFLFTCVKDGRKYINKLFDSLLSQTKINFVHYIYEDGSADPIEDLVDIYKEKVSKLSSPYKVIYEKNPINIGLNMATKHCIDMCNLPYFIWIDCDNWVDKDFFKEIEKCCLKKPKADLIRTRLIGVGFSFNVDKPTTNNNTELQLFLRSKYYYSFFAVKTKKYLYINKNNYMSDVKTFFNDNQVLMCLLLSKCKIALELKAIGYFGYHPDSMSACNLPLDRGKNDQLLFLKNVSNKLFEMLDCYYYCKTSMNKITVNYRSNPVESLSLFRDILRKIKVNKLNYRILHCKPKFIILFKIGIFLILRFFKK